MLRNWIASHRSLLATATSAVVVGVIVATTAIISTGFSAQRLDLNDASVWVANESDQYIGRANTEVFELNTIVESASSDVEVVQSGSTVLMVDRTDAKLDIVDPATSDVADTVALPPNQARVFLAGTNVIIYSQSTGELWTVPLNAVATFDASQVPSLNLGADSVVSVDANGLLFAFSHDAGQVFRVDAAAAAVVQETTSTQFAPSDDLFEITSVGGQWAVLNTDTGVLETAAGVTELGDDVSGTPVLQTPSADGDAVLVAHAGGLLSVRFGAGATTVVSDRTGAAAAPSVVAGCEYAAWADGGAWRRCAADPASGTAIELSGMPGVPQLVFQTNGDRLVLNDARAGASWAVQADGELIDNWDDLIATLDDEQQVEQNDESTPPETEQAQLPPVAVDDFFGARPGRSSPVSVLLNDYDPNGDVLVVTAVDALDPSLGRVDIIHDSQALQITLAPGATGAVTFGYTISDGRGGDASAKVTITVRAATENSPPQQVRQTRADVASGGQVTLEVLGDWVDPDGDPFYLSSASVASPDTVAYKPDGTVVYSDNGAGGTDKSVILVASDGTADGLGTLAITVSPSGTVPIVCDAFVVRAYAGVEVRVAPLEHVRGGNGTVRLNAVPPKSGVTTTANFERGTFRVLSDVVGTHYLDYVVTDDVQTVSCIVRVDVAAPPESNTTPVTVPKTVFVRTLGSQTVDVASTDIDPGGGVLLVTGVTNIPAGSGVRAEVLEQRAVRITLEAPLSGPVTFTYRISNGLAEAEGTITVIEIPPPAQRQPPIARDDTATARVGDAITIRVMDNDEHPDGDPVSLASELVDNVGDDSGLLFVAGSTLRYLAPDHPGNVTATYRVLGPDGQYADAQVTIQVREPTVDTNHAPAPSRITARVLAGEQVRIDIPLDGIDPDGDSVQLLGQSSSPEKGTVIEVGADYILYEAGEYSPGTDTFTYTLIDALGARATGTIRVGISARLDGARNPVATEDAVTVRPGSSISVQVLANDSDPDGGALRVTSVVPNDDETIATITQDSIVTITPPSAEGTYGLVYSIANERGGTSSNFITVTVSNDAPLSYPIASDTVLTLSDTLDRDTIDVSVLDRVFFADGPVASLGVSVLAGYPSAEVLPNKQIRVTIGDERQIIPFAVSHPDDPAVRSYAFIWVPGFNDALPQLDRKAPRLVVTSEETLTINLNDYVIAVGGKQVRLTDSSTVTATHADGSSLVVDRDTLQYRSSDLYYGSASISFEVTDGTSATDPNGRTAILVLPITVNPRTNQAPSFNGAAIEFEPGQEKVINLLELTTYPYADDLDELVYTVADAAPAGFSFRLTGAQLTITADDDAVKKSTASMTIGVRDAVTAGKSGRIDLSVVPSTRPLARPAADNEVAKRGSQTVIDVLANDEATNPFPGQPLSVVQVVGTNGESLPAGVTVTVSADRSRVTVDVAASAAPVDVNLQYQVADATNDTDRYAWGSVRVSIQDVPDAPAKPSRQDNSFVGGELVLRFAAPQPNNSPVSNYRVTSASNGGYSHDCGTSTICSLPGLAVGELYTFQVVATNAIGDSAASPLSDAFSIDYLPAAPATVTAVPTAAASAPTGGSIDVSWSAVASPNPGTAITGYTVVVVGVTSTTVPASTTNVTIPGLSADVVYTVVVHARNSAQVTRESDWNRTSTTVRTVGPPSAPSPAPQATSATTGDIEVTWGASSSNGGGTVTFGVERVTGSATPSGCTPSMATGATSPYVDTTAVDGETYTYFVYASNGSYCVATATGATVSLQAPGATTGNASIAQHGSTGQFDILAGNLSASGTVVKYQYLLSSDGTWRDLPADGFVTFLGAPGATYGQAIDVSFRACRNDSDSYCGPASATSTLTPVNTRVTSASCAASSGVAPTIDQPLSTGAVTASYEVSYNQPILVLDNWSSWGPASDAVPGDAIEMRVRATVNGYTDPGYGQFSCTP